MFSSCCCVFCHSAQVKPGDENGEYVKINENKKLFVSYYKTVIKNEITKTDNADVIINKEIKIEEQIDNNLEVLKNSFFNHDNSLKQDENEKYEHLGVYNKIIYYLMNPGLIVNFYESDKEKSGCTVVYRQRFKDLCRNSIAFNTSEKPLLFLIHGVGGCGKIWSKQISYFIQKGYECVIPDLLGHGKSSKDHDEKSYLFTNLAQDILFIFDKYKKAKNIIIGHSYGCSFATYLAKVRTDVIDKIILISGGSPYPLDYQSPILKFPMCCLHLMRPWIDCVFYRYDTHDTFNLKTNILQKTMKGQYWPEGNELFHRSLSQKMLILEGSQDKLVEWEDSFDLFRVVFNSFFVIIENGSHMSIIEDDDLVNRIIENFIIGI